MPTLHDHQLAAEALLQDHEDQNAADKLVELALAEPALAEDTRRRLDENYRFLEVEAEAAPPRAFEMNNLELVAPPPQHEPRSLAEIIRLVEQQAAVRGATKAVGGAYAFSNITATDGALIRTARLRRFLAIHADEVSVDPANLLRFEAGATIDDINQRLGSDRALLNQPGFERLSFVGTMCTGGHGSGIRLGPICNAVRAIHIVTSDADGRSRQLQIEPSRGISIPERFSARHPDVTLRQDDKLFAAALVSMGCLGVVYSVTIETRPFYFLQEDREIHRWPAIRAQLPALLADTALHSFAVWLNPYPVRGEQSCVLSTYRQVSGPRRGRRGLGITLGGSQILANLTVWWVNRVPGTTPALMNAALRSTTARGIVMPCTEALNFGGPNGLDVQATEAAVDVAGALETADFVSSRLQTRAAQTKRYTTSPVGMRFADTTEALLAPQFRRASCMFELPILAGTKGARETINFFCDAMYDRGARPHWGQQIDRMTPDRMRALYPRLADFIDVYRELNPLGLFDNAFTRQIGLSTLLAS
jgi:hypothetical protein